MTRPKRHCETSRGGGAAGDVIGDDNNVYGGAVNIAALTLLFGTGPAAA